MVSIRPGYLTFYSEATGGGSASRYQDVPQAPPERHTADGLISHKAQRRLCQSVDWLLYLSKPKKLYPKREKCGLQFRLNFITLSLSSDQVHDDNTIKRDLLQPFLDTLRKTWNCKHYLWRAESQRNGRIHFHLVTDQYIAWWKIRNRWNAIQNRLGYIDRWEGKTKSKQPNSTDVHSIRKVRKLGAYLAKYCAKNPKGAMYTALEEKDGQLAPCYNPSDALHIYSAKAEKYRSIGGKLWGLSYSLSQIRSAVACVHDIKDQSLHRFWQLFGQKAEEYDHHTCVYVPVATWAKQVRGDLYTLFSSYLDEYRNLQPDNP